MNTLWRDNTPAQFWQCQPNPSYDAWLAATRSACAVLELPAAPCDLADPDDMDAMLALVLGEGQFGSGHWALSRSKRMYYQIKPLIPRGFTRVLRQVYSRSTRKVYPLGWPVEPRYARFQWEVMRHMLQVSGRMNMDYRHFWPLGKRFALVLTHDVETAQGQAFVPEIADLETRYGFRSSFNFVPERYPVNHALLDDLRTHGFEIGVHGLNHDGKLFNSYQTFQQRATRINAYLEEWGAVGFRAPLTMRHPEWMQSLNIAYDASFFDTDPFEPIAGGTMSIWPFMLGRFVELPYTLVQDYTLAKVLKQTTPRMWIEKVEFVRAYHGLVSVNTHPDYLRDESLLNLYTELLEYLKRFSDYWHALPQDVAQWWRKRATNPASRDVTIGHVMLTETGIELR